MSGHNYWLGDRMGCTILFQNRTLFVSEGKRKNNTIYRKPNEEHPPFEFRFLIVRMRYSSGECESGS